jgi:hypothetical protein
VPLYTEERASDSPFVERIWRTQPGSAGDFTSIANSNWCMVVTRLHGTLTFTLRGPETRPTQAYCPPDAEHFGIIFKVGTVMPHLPASSLVDQAADMPNASRQSFWLNGEVWQFPNYDNADVFIDWLVRDGLVVREPAVKAALQGIPSDVSLRSVQRRFLNVTGITHKVVYQIERARYATMLLKQGMAILDVVDQAGYADQPHLTRALKRWIGKTPAQLSTAPVQLSYMFKPLSF